MNWNFSFLKALKHNINQAFKRASIRALEGDIALVKAGYYPQINTVFQASGMEGFPFQVDNFVPIESEKTREVILQNLEKQLQDCRSEYTAE